VDAQPSGSSFNVWSLRDVMGSAGEADLRDEDDELECELREAEKQESTDQIWAFEVQK
jgi:hypothetical protein